MVGAITFLNEWTKICKGSKCKNCELFLRGVCVTQLRDMDEDRIRKAVHTVQILKARGDVECR